MVASAGGRGDRGGGLRAIVAPHSIALDTLEREGLPLRAVVGRGDRVLRAALVPAGSRRPLAARTLRLPHGGTVRARWRLGAAVLARLRPGRYAIRARAGRRAGRLRGRTRTSELLLIAAPARPAPGTPTPGTPATGAPSPAPPSAPPPGTAAPTVVAAAGDISCDGVCGQDETAALITDVVKPKAVLGLGDYQYDTGTLQAFAAHYDPWWGPFKPITYTINGGSHDFYGTGDYLTYFNDGGPVRLEPEGSYSFDVGAWHVVALNSYCFERSSCDEAKWTQWLRDDLAAHPAPCTLAYWHQPYWTSPSNHEPTAKLKPWVQALYDAGADVVLQAHNHHYERFASQDPDSRRDDARGLTAFVVGTGGRSHYSLGDPPAANSVARNDDTYGVLTLTLHPDRWDFRFVPEPGRPFTDAGSGTCH